MARLRATLSGLGPALVVGLGGLALWEGVVRGFGIREFLLPRPSSIVGQLIDHWPILRHAGWETGSIAVSGLLAGIVAGVLLALVTTRFRTLDEGLTPLAVAVNATPIVALAPIFNAWFGITGTLSNQAVVTAVVFFPVFINTARGLTDVHPDEVELMRSYAAPWRTTLFKLRLPAARAYLFPALKLAATLSVVGAIVGEISIGTKTGLGRAILEYAQRYAVSPERLYASVVGAAVLGLSVFGMVNLAERLVMKRTEGVERADRVAA